MNSETCKDSQRITVAAFLVQLAKAAMPMAVMGASLEA
jgi:hypothetical protein